jgi:pimeloyl-ACP methyl ester carboxylesterase
VALLAAASLLLSGCGRGGGSVHVVASGLHPDGQVNVQQIVYRSSFDGSRVAALVAIPRAVPSRGCFIWQFGFGSKKEESSLVWQGLASLGLTTVSIDFRYTGSRASSQAETSQVLTNPTMLPKLIRGTLGDLHSLIDYLEKQPYCWRNIAYGGESLGGAIGTILAATDKRVKAAVLIATPGHWRGVRPVDPEVASRPGATAAFARLLSPLDPDRFIGRISGRPVLIMNGISDRTVPLSNARALQAAARQPKTIIDYTGGHNLADASDVSSYAEAVASFLLRTIVEPTYGLTANPNATFSRP